MLTNSAEVFEWNKC